MVFNKVNTDFPAIDCARTSQGSCGTKQLARGSRRGMSGQAFLLYCCDLRSMSLYFERTSPMSFKYH
jgi:hypothetical protein